MGWTLQEASGETIAWLLGHEWMLPYCIYGSLSLKNHQSIKEVIMAYVSSS